MAKFTVNGRAVTVENNQKLLRYLRDTLHLTSVKDGCSEDVYKRQVHCHNLEEHRENLDSKG